MMMLALEMTMMSMMMMLIMAQVKRRREKQRMSRLSAQLAQDLAPLSPPGINSLPRMPPSITIPIDVGEPPNTLFAFWGYGGVRARCVGVLKHHIIQTNFSDIERYARIAFPLVFFTFHLMYWTILVSISETVVEDLVPLKIV